MKGEKLEEIYTVEHCSNQDVITHLPQGYAPMGFDIFLQPGIELAKSDDDDDDDNVVSSIEPCKRPLVANESRSLRPCSEREGS